MRIVFYTRVDRLWLERIDECNKEFGHAEFIIDEGEARRCGAFFGGA